MATIHMVLRDTDDGLVDVETTVEGWDDKSNAQALANRLNGFMAEIAQLQPGEPAASDCSHKNTVAVNHPQGNLQCKDCNVVFSANDRFRERMDQMKMGKAPKLVLAAD